MASSLPGAARFARNALFAPDRPLLAQLVVTRFCNLDCGYCNEFDKVSKPVPLADMLARIDAIAALGTAAVTLTGGEPLTHPDLAALVARVRLHGMICTLISNGFLLTRAWIEALGAAGLQGLQISIDNIAPDAVSRKSLKSLRGKLQLLRDHARFPVNVNSVLGLGDDRAADAIEVTRVAREMGFSSSAALVHDGDGHLHPMSEGQHAAYHAIMAGGASRGQQLNYRLFQKNLIAGLPNDWKCRAGGRYLYICEDGLVHYCSQQRGSPGVPVADYTAAHIRCANAAPKPCAPFCTLPCVHQMSAFDRWRRQDGPPPAMMPPPPAVELAA